MTRVFENGTSPSPDGRSGGHGDTGRDLDDEEEQVWIRTGDPLLS